MLSIRYVRICFLLWTITLSSIFVSMAVVCPAKAEQPVLLAQYSHMSPWKFLDHGRETGIDIELLRQLAMRMGMRIDFEHVPFPRGLKAMQDGEIDIMTGVLRRPEREQYLLYIEPPYNEFSPKVFYVRKGQESSIRSYEDLQEKRIGTTIDTRYFARFDADKTLHKEPVSRSHMNLMKLVRGRLDAVILSETAGDQQIREAKLEPYIGKADYRYRDENRVYIAISKASPFAARYDEFCAVMKEFVDSGLRKRIKEQFTEQYGFVDVE